MGAPRPFRSSLSEAFQKPERSDQRSTSHFLAIADPLRENVGSVTRSGSGYGSITQDFSEPGSDADCTLSFDSSAALSWKANPKTLYYLYFFILFLWDVRMIAKLVRWSLTFFSQKVPVFSTLSLAASAASCSVSG